MRGHGRHNRGNRRRGRSLLRPTLLFLMLQGPAHGYDLAERLRSFGVLDIDPSLIYRALRDMEANGLITSAWDEKKTQGPPRRVYTLSDEGHSALAFYIDDLRSTRDRINQLVDAYMKNSSSESRNFHHTKGDE